MGEVYRAHDTVLDREVALKVLSGAVMPTRERLERFRREALATARLSHPNILAVHDFSMDGDVPYAVTELLQGETLRQRLSGSVLHWNRAVELAAAHGKNVVHRDLKPENIFITADGRVKILDFGLARLDARGDDASFGEAPTGGLTGAGRVLGTLGYMAPEQINGRPTDHRTDLFALGCILFEMVTGRRAFTAASAGRRPGVPARHGGFAGQPASRGNGHRGGDSSSRALPRVSQRHRRARASDKVPGKK